MLVALGVVGVGLILLAYILMQMERVHARGRAYNGLNFIGSLLVMLSLLEQWNLATFIIELVWSAVSAVGLWRAFRRMGRKNTESA